MRRGIERPADPRPGGRCAAQGKRATRLDGDRAFPSVACARAATEFSRTEFVSLHPCSLRASLSFPRRRVAIPPMASARPPALAPMPSLPHPLRNARRAAALGLSGAVFLGANIEFPGLPLSQSVHAEQFALCNAALAGERGLTAIAVNEAPCGHCRQFLSELPSAGELSVVAGGRPTRTLAELLPDRFGPEALLHDDGSHRLLTNDPIELRLTVESRAALEALDAEPRGLLAAAVAAALARAEKSYAPYTGSQAGLAFGVPAAADAPELVVAGAALESAAYNPTLPPFQAAAVALRVAGGWDRLADVAECVLVERRGAPTSHAAVTRAAIETVAPKARFVHLLAEP